MEASKPINKNHLQGSKMLINFVILLLLLEKPPRNRLRYLKQIKARNTEIKFDAENVRNFAE
jgi:hypothetical protein